MAQKKVRSFCLKNFASFLQQSTLHGLRFVGDDSLSLLERGFFLCTFVAALTASIYLCLYYVGLMTSMPVIIGIDPYPTIISQIPFPAVTFCNMNKLLLSKVAKYSKNSNERAAMDVACFHPPKIVDNELTPNYGRNNLSITDFIIEHAQPCSEMLLKCEFASKEYNCSELFETHLTDSGLCCVFNFAHPKFRTKPNARIGYSFANISGSHPVDWSPEIGYGDDLPEEFVPRVTHGIGMTMGLTVILDAQLHEYYCSSTNGPGFKFDLHNPIDDPRVKDNGLPIAPGKETRLRLKMHRSSASSRTRKLGQLARRCVFNDENHLLHYKYYTRKSCVSECKSKFIHSLCDCIPHELPFVSPNASVCGIPQTHCVLDARKLWVDFSNSTCRRKCLRACFDVSYSVRENTADLVEYESISQHRDTLKPFNPEYIRRNIAIVNICYIRPAFYGDVRNVYMGFHEFLTDVGAILGLFLGFSFISLTEIFYFALMRPLLWWQRIRNRERESLPKSKRNSGGQTRNEFKENYEKAAPNMMMDTAWRSR